MGTMRLHPARLEATFGDGDERAAPLTGDGPVALGPLAVRVTTSTGGDEVTWAVANRGDEPVAVRAVRLVFDIADAAGPLRMFRNGYQSWSPTGVATLGTDVDPSTAAGFEFLQAVHHADQRTVARAGELRSEWVTVLADASGAPVLVGFEGGDSHDGTLRLAPAERAGGRAELRAEAFLGGAVLPAGATRALHPVLVHHGTGGDTPSAMLDRWAGRTGRAGAARVAAPYQVGWCSWYQYFMGITEETFLGNLALADGWPFDVFQLDDGYQAAIGDWLEPDPSFPGGLPAVADAVVASGRTAGVWLAPFLAAPASRLLADHPGWAARTADGAHPLRAWWNPGWNGGGDGFLYALDTTDPEVLAHLESVAADLVAMGFGYLKLDFTFAPSVDGRWRDATRTPAERVRAGFDAIRRGAGDDAFILGCGVPLAHVVGVVDGCRIGQDVAPLWHLSPADEIVPGYLGIQPATQHAYVNTATRAFMHRRLWLNDPDCVMLRTVDTALAPAAARGWAHAVGMSGGMALVSDDLALLDAGARALLDETVALGRASDDVVRAGLPVVVPDLMDSPAPAVMESAGRRLTVDPATGTAELVAPPAR